MRQHLILFGTATMLLLSCKKNTEENNTPQSETGNKLVKLASTDGQYTSTTFYSYDGDGRLSNVRYTSSGGTNYNYRIVRKDGRIEKVVGKDAASTDSTTYTVASNGSQYLSVEEPIQYGPGVVASRRYTFTYDAAGNISEALKTSYYNGVPDPQSRIMYTYSNKNLTALRLYRISGGTNNLADQYDAEYDAKTNPLPTGPEAVVLAMVGINFEVFASANNFTKLVYKDVGQPTETTTATYTYNDKGLPLTAVYKSSDPSVPAENITYTYQ